MSIVMELSKPANDSGRGPRLIVLRRETSLFCARRFGGFLRVPFSSGVTEGPSISILTKYSRIRTCTLFYGLRLTAKKNIKLMVHLGQKPYIPTYTQNVFLNMFFVSNSYVLRLHREEKYKTNGPSRTEAIYSYLYAKCIF
jgi:hypothetical protein